MDHWIISHINDNVSIRSKFNCNDIESSLVASISGFGIGKFTELNVKNALAEQKLRPILTKYDWGSYNLYAVYSKQHALPKRTRIILEYICQMTSVLLVQA